MYKYIVWPKEGTLIKGASTNESEVCVCTQVSISLCEQHLFKYKLHLV